jgi:hypothetical protein
MTSLRSTGGYYSDCEHVRVAYRVHRSVDESVAQPQRFVAGDALDGATPIQLVLKNLQFCRLVSVGNDRGWVIVNQ